MKLVEFLQLLQGLAKTHGKRTFLLREIAALSGASRAATGMTLLRAQKQGLVFRLGNLWVNQLDPPPLEDVALALRSPSYISFESALYRRGILSQSPRGQLTLATPRRSGVFATPLGAIRFIHLKTELFFGYDEARMAYPEKAWLDLVYIRGRRGREGIWTEKFYPKNLNRKRLKDFSKKFPPWVAQEAQAALQLRD